MLLTEISALFKFGVLSLGLLLVVRERDKATTCLVFFFRGCIDIHVVRRLLLYLSKVALRGYVYILYGVNLARPSSESYLLSTLLNRHDAIIKTNQCDVL